MTAFGDRGSELWMTHIGAKLTGRDLAEGGLYAFGNLVSGAARLVHADLN